MTHEDNYEAHTAADKLYQTSWDDQASQTISMSYGGGVVLHQIFGKRVQHAIKNWTKSDRRFCKNERSKRSKINEKGGQLDQKSRRKLILNA